MNARDGKLDSFHNNNLDKGNIEKGWPFHTEYWTWKYNVCIYVIRLYNTGERSEPKKKLIILVTWKQPIDPLSYSSNLYTRPHLWQISGGGGQYPRSPLWIRAWCLTKIMNVLCQLWPWPCRRSLKMNRVHSVMIGNKWVRFDENKLNSGFSIMFTMLFHMFIMTLTSTVPSTLDRVHLLVIVYMYD